MATVKQKKAAKALVGNGGNVTQAMLDAGYSPATANTPQKLTESEGFKEVWEELIPKRLIIETHKRILKKTDKDGQPHTDAAKGVDMAYKIDGAYAPDKHLNVNVEVEPSPEIRELAKKLNDVYRGNDQ
jgi:hypothetical protein